MREVENWVQFRTKASKLYLSGERYCTQPIHTGRFARFLQQPDTRDMTRLIIGMSWLTDLWSSMMLPKNMPKDIPLKLRRQSTSRQIKNWVAVLDSPANQQTIRISMRGNMTPQGSSTMLRLRKQAVVLQSLEFSSLRKICLSLGKVRALGTIEVMKVSRLMKQKKPLSPSHPFYVLWLLLMLLKQRPPRQMNMTMVWNTRCWVIRGYLVIFFQFLLISCRYVVQTPTSIFLGTISELFLLLIFSSTLGVMLEVQLSKYRGYLLTLSWSSGWVMAIKQSAGLQNSGHLKPKLRSKQSTAQLEGPWYTIFPSTRRKSRSKRSQMSLLGWWMVMMTVLFLLLAKLLRYCTIIKEVRESSPAVGQSKINNSGSLIIQKAIDVRFFYPPDMPLIKGLPMSVSRHRYNLSCRLSSSTFIFFYSSEQTSFRFAANSRVYRTVIVPIRISFCMTQFPKSPNCSQPYGILLARSQPCCNLILQAIRFSRVVLPAPEGPMMAATYPALKMPDMGWMRTFSWFYSASMEYLRLVKERSMPLLRVGVQSSSWRMLVELEGIIWLNRRKQNLTRGQQLYFF